MRFVRRAQREVTADDILDPLAADSWPPGNRASISTMLRPHAARRAVCGTFGGGVLALEYELVLTVSRGYAYFPGASMV